MRSFEFALKNGEKIYKDAQLPEYQTKRSAGADFFCAERVRIPSMWDKVISALIPRDFIENGIFIKDDVEKYKERYRVQPTIVHTGIKASMEDDEVLELFNRSSNPKKLGLVLANSVGVVDSDYYGNPDNDGEIMFAFYNFMPWSVEINVGDRIGQGVFKKYLRPIEGLRIKDGERKGGFGSTD